MTEKTRASFNLNVSLDFRAIESEGIHAGLCGQIPMLVVGHSEEEARSRLPELLEFSTEILQEYDIADLFRYLMERKVSFRLEIVYPGAGVEAPSDESQPQGQEIRQMELTLAG